MIFRLGPENSSHGIFRHYSAVAPLRYFALSALASIGFLTGCAGIADNRGFESEQDPATPLSQRDRQHKPPKPDPVVERVAHSAGNEPEDNSSPTSDDAPDIWVRIREGLQLAGHEQQLPVRRMVQFYAGQQRHLRDSSIRAQPYLRHIVDSIEARDMPMEIALLPLVESSFDPFAGGGRRASGLWQFMPITAKRFGLNKNDWYEGRRDVLLSTAAALDYLSWLNLRFGDWLLALAAYNAGEGRIDQALKKAERQGKPANFWHLDLPNETERYIPKLLALGELVAEPEKFAITWPSTPDEPAFVAVELPARTSLSTAADLMDVTVGRLRTLNPALRSDITQPGGPHVLLVPAARAQRFEDALAEISDPVRLRWNRHAVESGETLSDIASNYGVELANLVDCNELDDNRLTVGQKLWIPKVNKAERRSLTSTSPPPKAAAKGNYKVAAGDSLWKISRAHDVSVSELRQLNGLDSQARLQPGQILKLGSAATNTPTKAQKQYYRVRSGDSLWKIAKRFGTSVTVLRRLNNLGRTPVLKPGQRLLVSTDGPRMVYHQVRKGDSLWSIATRYKVGVAQIKNWNGLQGKALIKPGQKLKILVAAATG